MVMNLLKMPFKSKTLLADDLKGTNLLLRTRSRRVEGFSVFELLINKVIYKLYIILYYMLRDTNGSLRLNEMQEARSEQKLKSDPKVEERDGRQEDVTLFNFRIAF